MPRGISPEHQLQRDAILQAAAEAFAERGYPATTMAGLAGRLNVSKSLLYHYYPSKDAILFDLTAGYMRRLATLVHEVEARALPAQAALAELVRRFVSEYESSRAVHIVLLNDVKYLPDEQRDEVLGLEREVVDAFARVIGGSHALDRAAAKVLTMCIFGMINWTFTWLRPHGPVRYADFAETVIGLIEGGLAQGAKRLEQRLNPQQEVDHESHHGVMRTPH
ncbi:MAG: TetR/AcrR family transcriptional regulator [Casimicrobiaceae bacterium]|nr:TetR/AcrR family transcriptional regulator [Casimicrobiaceae bacterium]MCX8098162.1 TetR/AcrR family transcriptional regulator [Casimicrobiaceae bacterium]